ncbi:MAG: hypothetical protein WC730_00870 [Patescibacteria group bacterium]|jgi:3D (Asp-Asp-Asp) domain-containing protein
MNFAKKLKGYAQMVLARFPFEGGIFLLVVGSLILAPLASADAQAMEKQKRLEAVFSHEQTNKNKAFGSFPHANLRLPAQATTIPVTAYNSVTWQTDSTPCIGAQGTDICSFLDEGSNTCAANFVPLGTKLHVEGLGTCVVRDRMNDRYYYRVDWYMGEDITSAKQFGVQYKEVGVYPS